MIDDENEQDVRVFSLAPLAANALVRFSEALSPYETSTAPVWVPRWKFPTAAEQSALEQLTDQIIDEAGPPELAIASADLGQEIVAAKAITAENLVGVTDWFSFLGLVRK